MPPELFGLRAPGTPPAGAVVRRHPGALPGEPVIEYEVEPVAAAGGAAPPRSSPRRPAPAADHAYDQRPEGTGPPFAPGDRVRHTALGEGVVRACDGAGAEAKVTVAFFSAGEKRVIARYLRRA